MSKIYFASDFHLGIDARLSSADRERQIVRWLDMVSANAETIYLVGDIFDFWFEYRTVVPKGYLRLFGKLAELVDGGLPIHIFTGNHDMWLGSYVKEELGIEVIREPITVTHYSKRFMIGHGDGLGPGDYGYKFIKKVFANPICQWCYARIHPNTAFGLANFWSSTSRKGAIKKDKWLGKENEWLVQYAEEKVRSEPIDYFVFGHRHLPIFCTLQNSQSIYLNLGDWLDFNSYASFDGKDLKLDFFENEGARAIVI
jgi:UDP-2,3-diacylglucosamine hydrolase